MRMVKAVKACDWRMQWAHDFTEEKRILPGLSYILTRLFKTLRAYYAHKVGKYEWEGGCMFNKGHDGARKWQNKRESWDSWKLS